MRNVAATSPLEPWPQILPVRVKYGVLWCTDALGLSVIPSDTDCVPNPAHHPLAEADALAGLEHRKLESAGRLLRSRRDGVIGAD